MAYVYLALMVGIVPTALLAAVAFLGVRRLWLVCLAVGIAVVGFVAPVPIIGMFSGEGGNLSLGLLVMRLVAVALGYLLTRAMAAPVRGHQVLHGGTISLIATILPAFGWALLTPWSIQMWLELPALALAAEMGW